MNNNHDNSDDDRLADVLGNHVDNENTEYDPEKPYGKVGIGKTTRHVEMMAAISNHDEMEPEFIDPKGGGEKNGE